MSFLRTGNFSHATIITTFVGSLTLRFALRAFGFAPGERISSWY